jgi:rare lipoprotein A
MRKLAMGCAMAGLIVLSPASDAKSPGLSFVLPATQEVTPNKPLQQIPQPEVGVASWYGTERQGNKTASGQSFDGNGLTAAHRRLPMGTLVRVTNLRNLASTLLKITDRGPGADNRVIDVSWAAAKTLGFLNAGLARVEIDVVSYPGSTRQMTLAELPAAY